MAFSTLRGRPRTTPKPDRDPGTPELRLKHAIGATTEPIDLCLERTFINREQHWCGLHLRWLYTVRYGAPVLSTRYGDRVEGTAPEDDDPTWRALREREYHDAIMLLRAQRRYEPVMRLCVYNELPAFLSPSLQQRAWDDHALAGHLLRAHHMLCEGLDILTLHWRSQRKAARTP